jgi:hypothetical protein
MSTAKQNYMASFEVLNALLIAIGLFMICCFFGWLIYFVTPILDTILQIQFDTIAPTVASGIIWMFMALFLGLVWSVFIFIIALLQYLALAVPISSFMSQGLESDAKRSWIFYTTSGALIGGGPWWILGFFILDEKADFGSLFVFLAPALSIGLFAGAVLKYRLIKLVKATDIENNLV